MANQWVLIEAVARSAGVPFEVARWMLEHSSRAILDIASSEPQDGKPALEMLAEELLALSTPPALATATSAAPWLDPEMAPTPDASADEDGDTYFGPHGAGGGRDG